jgi:hypothetical protein
MAAGFPFAQASIDGKLVIGKNTYHRRQAAWSPCEEEQVLESAKYAN